MMIWFIQDIARAIITVLMLVSTTGPCPPCPPLPPKPTPAPNATPTATQESGTAVPHEGTPFHRVWLPIIAGSH